MKILRTAGPDRAVFWMSDVHVCHQMKRVSNGKNGDHDVLHDEVASIPRHACVECTNNKTLVSRHADSGKVVDYLDA